MTSQSKFPASLSGRWTPTLVFLLSLALYVFTLGHDLLPADNGEFQLVAATFGVAHPPGYALHTLLSSLVARVPLGSLLWRVNLLSALTAACTLTIVYLSVRRLTRRSLPALLAALLLATSTTFWAQATIVNIRTMAALFTSLMLYTAICLIQEQDSSKGLRWLAALALVITLGVTHHMSLIFFGVLVVIVVIWKDHRVLLSPKAWLMSLLAVVIGLLPLLYLVLRAGESGSPEYLDTWKGFTHYVLALGFSGDFLYFTSLSDLIPRLRVMLNVFRFQFHPAVLVAWVIAAAWMVVGVIKAKDRARRPFVLLLICGMLLHTIITATYRAPQTVEYMLPAYLLSVILVGWWLGSLMNNDNRMVRSSALLAISLMTLVGLRQLANHWDSFRALANEQDTREYCAQVLDGAPEGAAILSDWHWVKPMQYLQQVEGVRQDLQIEYVPPTDEPYGTSWANRILDEVSTRDVVVTHFDRTAYSSLSVFFEPLGEAYSVRTEPRRQLPKGFEPTELVLGGTVRLVGYRIEQHGSGYDLSIAWSPAQDDVHFTLSCHLIGFDGASYGQHDRILDSVNLNPGDIQITRFRLEMRPGALPGLYSLQVGVYGEGITPDRQQMLTVEKGLQFTAPFTQRKMNKRFTKEISLIGVDWDQSIPGRLRLYLHWFARKSSSSLQFDIVSGNTVVASSQIPALEASAYQTTVHNIPPGQTKLRIERGIDRPTRVSIPDSHINERYVPFGDGIVFLGPASTSRYPNEIVLEFAASHTVLRDYVTSAWLIDEDSQIKLAQNDGIPALGSIPTLKWIAGSRVQDPKYFDFPLEQVSGKITGALVIYDAFTQETLPMLDERLAEQAPWAPIGEWEISN